MLSSEVKAELLGIVDQLAELEKRRNEIRQQQYEVRDRRDVIRAKSLIEIAIARDDKEKPVYSTEHIREAALMIVLENDSEYRVLRDRLRILENKLQDISIEHARLSSRKEILMLDAGLAYHISSE